MIKIDKWVYTTDEVIKFFSDNAFDDYTLFIESQIVERHDNSFVCGTWVITSNKDYEELIKFICIYGDKHYLLTKIDVECKHIIFNLIKEY